MLTHAHTHTHTLKQLLRMFRLPQVRRLRFHAMPPLPRPLSLSLCVCVCLSPPPPPPRPFMMPRTHFCMSTHKRTRVLFAYLCSGTCIQCMSLALLRITLHSGRREGVFTVSPPLVLNAPTVLEMSEFESTLVRKGRDGNVRDRFTDTGYRPGIC